MLGKYRLLMIALIFCSLASFAQAAGRHYYSSWSYYPRRSYYYVYYYYKPTPTYNTYNYHYCIYYPTRPRYVYYYNPYSRRYWGRYDLEKKGYSMLAEKDRKEKLQDVPESAFPEPAEMPAIPESKDGERMIPPPAVPDNPKDLPEAEKTEAEKGDKGPPPTSSEAAFICPALFGLRCFNTAFYLSFFSSHLHLLNSTNQKRLPSPLPIGAFHLASSAPIISPMSFLPSGRSTETFR